MNPSRLWSDDRPTYRPFFRSGSHCRSGAACFQSVRQTGDSRCPPWPVGGTAHQTGTDCGGGVMVLSASTSSRCYSVATTASSTCVLVDWDQQWESNTSTEWQPVCPPQDEPATEEPEPPSYRAPHDPVDDDPTPEDERGDQRAYGPQLARPPPETNTPRHGWRGVAFGWRVIHLEALPKPRKRLRIWG